RNCQTIFHMAAPLSHWSGIQVKNEKNRPSLKSLKTDNRTEKSKYKPLWGKVFYLDLPSVTISEKLQKDIKDLGGVSENQSYTNKKIFIASTFKYVIILVFYLQNL
uniref:BRCT domain-containing protein n=1 Tax=Spermophilus dauricus TaxID=99837 RepID=A0A8C9QM93_SPEDA